MALKKAVLINRITAGIAGSPTADVLHINSIKYDSSNSGLVPISPFDLIFAGFWTNTDFLPRFYYGTIFFPNASDGWRHFRYSFVFLFWFLCGSQHDDIISFRRNILIPLSIITYTFK